MIWMRADANREIGSGHVMRMLSVAAALKREGQQVCFLAADDNAAVLLQAKGQEYKVLHSDYRCMEEELPALERLFAQQGGSFFLVDSYFVTAEYFRQARKWMPVGYMDDLGLSGFPVDVLVNYNIFAEASLYEKDAGTRLFLGTQYVPLREEFEDPAHCLVREKVRQVLVTMGGSDKYNLAGNIVSRALKHTDAGKLAYCVVSGAYNAHLDELKALEREYPNVRICSNVANMRELMLESDIAVTAGGSTMYELSAVGLPIICLSYVDNQERIVEGFFQRKLVSLGGNYLSQGEAVVDEAVENIAMLAGDVRLRREYSQGLRKIVDGRGAARIARGLLQLCV